MKKVLSLLVVFMMLSLVACSDAPDEYVVSEPVAQGQALFEKEPAEEISEPIEESNYIGNINSMKFHEKDCSSVEAMKDENKMYFTSRQESIDKGFEPCQRCNP